jgi:MoaA/NifB/PqqE/SkfB family radical SAM enzyme
MQKLSLDNLAIEVTRKCNMKCAHCLRGDAQNKNISNKTLATVLENVESISSITFSGGEPSLNVKAIREFIRLAKDKGISVGSYFVSTNGKIANPDFLLAMLELHLFCNDNEISCLQVSTDEYHDYEGQDDNWINTLQVLKTE